MILFVFKRFSQTLLVIALLSFVVYFCLGFMPGDPIDLLITQNPKIKAEDIVRLKRTLGLDQPLYVRYFKWMKRALNGDMGESRANKGWTTVDLIKQRIPRSLKLMIVSFFVSLVVAIPIGIYSSMKQYSLFDYFTNFSSFIGISIPSFWLGLMFIIIFAEKWQIFPASGLQSIGGGGLLDQMKHMVLPVIVLSIQSVGYWVRFMRSSMLEVLQRDYIRTARSKGVDEDDILFKHALKNALIPVVTIVALSLPGLVSGALITEQVFSIYGMGKLLYDSIISVDYDVAMASFLFLAILTMFSNFLADILYAVVDPRIRYAGK